MKALQTPGHLARLLPLIAVLATLLPAAKAVLAAYATEAAVRQSPGVGSRR